MVLQRRGGGGGSGGGSGVGLCFQLKHSRIRKIIFMI